MLSDYGYLEGGAELLMHMLAENLRNQGHEVKIFASTARPQSAHGKPVIGDEWCYGTTSRLRAIVQSANPWSAWKLKKVIEDFKPDVVHLHMFLTQHSPLILNVLQKLPVVYSAHWFRSICMTGFKMLPDGSSCQQMAGKPCLKQGCVPLRDWLPLMLQLRHLNRRKETISAVVASSETIRSRLDTDGFTTDTMIHYGVRNLPERPKLTLPPRVGFAARLVKEKGGAILLQAFQLVRTQISTARLDVFGDGPELETLKELATTLGIENALCFHGYLEQEELQNQLARVWVQAAPTLFEEPGGVVGYEAAMRGTAMVASNHGGFRHTVIDGKTGYQTPPGDANELALALVKLLSDKQRAEEFGKTSRSRAKRLFSIDTTTEKYLGLYRELIRNHNAESENRLCLDND